MSVTVSWQTEGFDDALKAYKKRFGGKMKDIVKKIAFQIFRWTVKDTPVQTGNAKSNWRIEKGRGDNWIISNNTPYIRKLEYGGYPGQGDKTQPGQSKWTNDFVSKKAPKGMLRRAIFRAKVELKRMTRR